MFERYTENARTLMAFANIVGQNFNSREIKPEYVLLGLFQLRKGNAYVVLGDLGINFDRLKDTLKGKIQRGNDVILNKLPKSSLTNKVLEAARDYAIRLNHSYIATEHIVHGLITVPDNLAGTVLAELGITVDKCEEKLRPYLE